MNNKLIVHGTEITVTTIDDKDYISLTDMLRAKDGDFFISDWLRTETRLNSLGYGNRSTTRILIMANSPQLEARLV